MTITKKHIISACALLIAGLTACSDDPMDIYTPVDAGDAVKFAASSGQASRTIYDDENIFQINWENHDTIRIYTNKAYPSGAANAGYSVTPVETAGDGTNKLYNTGTIAAIDESSQLKWADNSEHKFIGVYPNHDKIKVDAEQGIVTFPINRNQVVQNVVTVQKDSYYKTKYGAYTYYCQPNMKNAYLTAFKNITPTDAAASNGDVFLDFAPVMTTLEIVVNGSKENTQPITVTGVSVSREIPSMMGHVNTSFKWNAVTRKLAYDNLDTSSPTRVTENTFVSLPADQEVILKSGESVVFTVFLPPFGVSEKYPISVRVHATGSTDVVTNLISSPINGGDKRRITTAEFPSNVNGNNWISRLDDDIYVSQLSIPGTHDSATGGGMDYHIEGGQTQYLSLEDQLKMGIRAFDLRPSIISSGLHIYHGIYKTLYSWEGALQVMKDYLINNPKEFVIIVFRHETEGANSNNNKETWKQYISNSMTSLKNAGLTVDFKPDLTVGECRGKILFFSRDRYTAADKPITGAYLGWNHSIGGGEMDIWGPDSPIGKINIQDCFNMSEAGCSAHWDPNDTKTEFKTKKWNAISGQLNKSATFHTDPNMVNRWSINHTSGYTAWKLPATNDYRENAAHQNPEFYRKVLDPSWEGSTGIIIADWVGTDISPSTWGTREYQVQGARMPQVIIDNNFKYHMTRKPKASQQ